MVSIALYRLSWTIISSLVEKFCTRYSSLEAREIEILFAKFCRSIEPIIHFRNFKNRDLEFRCTNDEIILVIGGQLPRVKRESVVVDSVGKIDPRYRSKRRAAEPAVGWPISCQSNWLAGRVPGHGRGGGEPCARLALPALHRTCIHASKRGSVHACPCNACNPFDRVRREGVHPSGKASSSASARPCANPWVRNAHPRARTHAHIHARTHTHTHIYVTHASCSFALARISPRDQLRDKDRPTEKPR